MSEEEASNKFLGTPRLLGVCDRTFRRYLDRFHESGVEGLIDKTLAPSIVVPGGLPRYLNELCNDKHQ